MISSSSAFRVGVAINRRSKGLKRSRRTRRRCNCCCCCWSTTRTNRISRRRKRRRVGVLEEAVITGTSINAVADKEGRISKNVGVVESSYSCSCGSRAVKIAKGKAFFVAALVRNFNASVKNASIYAEGFNELTMGEIFVESLQKNGEGEVER